MWISKEVRTLMAKYRTANPFELAHHLDYILIPYPFKNIRGILLVTDGVTFIGYNSSLPVNYQKLVVFHEIAHRLLHTNINYFMMLKNTYFHPGKLEYQANRFVAELVLSESRPDPGESIYEFAARHGVTTELAAVLLSGKQ